MSPEWFEQNRLVILTSTKRKDGLEPSGLTIYADDQGTRWLYLVSDNGKIARLNLMQTDLTKADLAAWEIARIDAVQQMEAVTTAKNKLMIGVEGGGHGKTTYARIKRFDPDDTRESRVGSFTGSEWRLTTLPVGPNAGLEAMTFVPDGAYPLEWGSSSYYGGLFFVASQKKAGSIFVYDLPKGNKTTWEVTDPVAELRLPSLPDQRLSGAHYSPETKILYVLYGDKNDWLQELVFNRNTAAVVQHHLIQLPYRGCEAVAVDQGVLFIGLDLTPHQIKKNDSDPNNHVFAYPDYINSH